MDTDDDIPISKGPGPTSTPPAEPAAAAPATPPAAGLATPADPTAEPEVARLQREAEAAKARLNGTGPTGPTQAQRDAANDMDGAPTRALTVMPPQSFELALEPTSLGIAFKLGQKLFDSLMYSRFPTPESITAVILRGREMGIPCMAALDAFHVIDNKPVPFAYLIIALAQRDPDCEYLYCIEASATSATWETKKRGNPKPSRCTFTYAMAEQAQLPRVGAKGPNGWIKNPEDMNVKSAGAKLARREYPGPTLGLVSLEEMGEA